MADFLVLEEDGTSHLDLEESTDGFLLEESSPHAKTGGGVVGAAVVVPPPPPVPPTSWQVGTLTVPSSTGNVSVTGLGGTPKAVFFYGTNWLTEDTAVTSTGTGLFRGMAAPKYDDPGTILQSAATVVIAGDAHHINNSGFAINQLNTSGSLAFLYTASVTSFDVDGFSVNFVGAAAGGYKVVYVALMGDGEVGAWIGTFDTTISLGWKAGASLLHGAWGGPDIGLGNRTQEFYGGGAYPGTNATYWESAGVSAFCFPTSASGQYNNTLDAEQQPHINITSGGHFTGPFLVTSNIAAYPSGTGLTDFINGGDATNGGMTVFWDDEQSRTRRTTPATSEDGTSTINDLPFAPALLLGYTISDEPEGQGTGSRGALGFSVVTETFEWCATVDGHSSRGAFQSFQRGFADTVNGSSVHAGTVELTNNGFVLTTEQDDTAAHDVIWHAFGVPLAPWIPHIYRQLVTA